MENYRIIEITDSTIDMLQPLADESTADGDTFIQKTIDEWKNGTNTFSKEGEKLWGMVIDDRLIGVGGLNRDPYSDNPAMGRVRHVYIAKEYRGKGLSKILMKLIIERAKEYFSSLRLATGNPIAAALYESLGFEKIDEYKGTHIIRDLAKA